MSLLSSLGAELKALQKLTGPRDPFARSQSYSLGSSLVSQSNSLDLDRLVTDPLHNGVVAACVNAIARALPDAPLLLEQRTASGWKIVEDHPCLVVLRSPNPDHSDADMWGLTSGYKATRGQAFWLLLPNSRGEVGEIHVWNPDRVTVLGDEEQFISGYRVQRESGTHFLADKRQIIHFRHLPDFSNPRLGWSPLRTGRAQIAGDNVAASYHTSILFNAGVVSLLISLKEGAMSGQVTPEQFQTVLTNLRRAGRERAGGIEGINLPLEVHKLAYSPDEMNIDRLIEYYETRICSVMGVSQRVAGLGSDPTYNNLSEALNDFWERRIVPDRNADAATLNRQWLPLWGLDGGAWRFRFDYSNVPALQENRDALHARVRSDFEKGLLDKQQARALLGYGTENDGEFARVFYGEKQGTQTSKAGISGAGLTSESVKVIDANGMSHGADGRFDGGSGSHSTRSQRFAADFTPQDISAQDLRIYSLNQPHPFQPQGISVSKALHLPQELSNRRSALEALDRVHGDGHLKDLAVEVLYGSTTGRKFVVGEYVPAEPGNYGEPDKRPCELSLHPGDDTPGISALHEIGHWLDDKMIGEGKMGTFGGMQALEKAVMSSDAVKKLKSMKGKETVRGIETTRRKTITYKVDKKSVEYYLENRELFARAYAQYVVMRSGDEQLQRELATFLKFKGRSDKGGATADSLHYPLHWEADDFQKIAVEMDKLLLSKGWMKHAEK